MKKIKNIMYPCFPIFPHRRPVECVPTLGGGAA
jgi:hypothetical protein